MLYSIKLWTSLIFSERLVLVLVRVLVLVLLLVLVLGSVLKVFAGGWGGGGV